MESPMLILHIRYALDVRVKTLVLYRKK